MRLIQSILFITLFICAGCNGDNDYVPKRTGYFRIAMPERKYVTYSNNNDPFTFDYPQYAKVIKDSGRDTPNPQKRAKGVWLNVIFPRFKCNLYLSYCVLDNNLNAYIEECRKMVTEHEIKASGINEQAVLNVKEKIYGDIYDIEGNTATNYQFYLTDSTYNFIRGALYFYAVPNKDSIQPVLDFVKVDIAHLINTFRWKR